MVFVNYGKQSVTWLLGSELTNHYIRYVGIGDGSGTVAVTDTKLVNERNRVEITGSPNFTTTQKATFQADFNSIQMSGISLSEFGLFHTGSNTGFTGSLWQRETLGSITFDGTNELQIITTLEVL